MPSVSGKAGDGELVPIGATSSKELKTSDAGQDEVLLEILAELRKLNGLVELLIHAAAD